MPRKFRYKPPVSDLIAGFFWMAGSISVFSTAEFSEYGYKFSPVFVLAILGFTYGLRATIVYVNQSSSAHILLGDTMLELPKFSGKPDSIKLSDIRFIAQTNPEDEIIKISSVNGFYRFNRKSMSNTDFEELMISLKQIAQANLTSITR